MIKIKNLTKEYSSFHRDAGVWNAIKSLFHREYEVTEAVKSINFTINKGEFVGFVGPNGAGKTTTLKMLSGILHPTSGEVTVNGFKPFERQRAFLKQIAFISAQKNQLWWDIPAQDSFDINQVIYEIDPIPYRNRIKELSESLNVTDLLTVPVRNLSLGERMKMEIISSILHSPQVIFMDEPTIGLDFISREEIRKFLTKYQRENNATIILTSHYFEDIVELCTRLILINNGTILVDDSLANITKDYIDKKILRIKSPDLEKISRAP